MARRSYKQASTPEEYLSQRTQVVAEMFNCSFSTVCKIWRKAGLTGKHHHA